MTRRTWLTLAPLAVAVTPRRAAALSEELFGNDPLPAGGYPPDVLAVINLPSRVYMVIGGLLHIPYCYHAGDVAAANAAVALFAKLTAPKKQVRLAAGPGVTHSFDKKLVPFDFACFPRGAYRTSGDDAPSLEVRVTAATAPAADVKALTESLDSPRFADRDAATRELARLGRAAKPGLRSAKAATASAEVRDRIDALLAKFTGTDVSDLVIPTGLPVAAASEKESTATELIRDDIARFIASRSEARR